jgi:hypothetical protein
MPISAMPEWTSWVTAPSASDLAGPHVETVEDAFAADADYAMLVKAYRKENGEQHDAALPAYY